MRRGFGAAAALLLAGLVATGPVVAADVETVAAMTEGPGNITITPEGRIIISHHQFYNPKYRVVEVLNDGTTKPFPNEQWSSAPGPDGVGLVSVLGLRSDPNGIVWMLDNGSTPPRLVAWDSRQEALYRIIDITPPAVIDGSFLNDLAVDPVNQAIYIADFADGPDKGAIVFVDLASGTSRRLLQGHHSTRAEDVRMVINGTPVRRKLPDGRIVEPRVGVNPITIDDAYQWVYFGPMHGTSLYRVRTADLRDASLSPEQLGDRVERYGDKPLSDGITIDADGNVYVTDVVASAIGVTRNDGTYQLLAQDPQKLSWPDGLSTGPDGYIYITVNQLNRSAALNAGVDQTQPPFYINRLQPLGPVAVGR